MLRLSSCRNLEEVDFDVDRFMKDMESVINRPGYENNANEVDSEEGSSSDMEFGRYHF